MPTINPFRIFALALALALLVATAACGGDEGASEGGTKAERQEITVNWGTEPPSLDPGLATDTTSANILLNIMDPLVKLNDDLEPTPSLAESWEEDGTTVTFNLRSDGQWTNGDPVTAQDFEYSWKRTLDPKLGADYAYQFYGIKGAEDYNGCEKNCAALRDEVGVKALDDTTLQVELTSPQPWFLQQVAHHSFLAVHRPTIEQYGAKWTESENIVTNGPFQLARWDHDSRIDLTKWADWRDADNVTLKRVNGLMLTEAASALQAFQAGEVDATQNIPPQDIPRLKETPEYSQYPALGTYYYGINLKNITDPKQRRAMSMAIDRRQLIDNITRADQLPATGYTPQGMPGFDTINPSSEWTPENADMEAAKQLMSEVDNPKRNITLYFNSDEAHKSIATAIQAQWKELGLNVTLKNQEWKQYLAFLGPPPNNDVDVYRLGWIGDYVDAMNFLEMWTCESGNNNTNYCDEEYDRLVSEARQTPDDAERYEIYAQLEEKMFGPDGAMPIIPIYWYTYVFLERESIKDTFNANLLDQIDLTKVEVVEQ